MTTAPSTQTEMGTPISAPVSEHSALERLVALLEAAGSDQLRVKRAGAPALELPASVIKVLRAAAAALAHGDAMSVVRVEQELTSQQAAELLNVSRQYVTRLADRGDLPVSTTAGGHRRFHLADVLRLQKQRDAGRKRALGELMDLTEDFGGYDELKGR